MRRINLKKIGISIFSLLLFLRVVLGIFDSFRKTPLEIAQEIYDSEGFDAYVEYVKEEKKYFPIKISADELTPLLLAIKNENASVASLFLETGASIIEKDLNGNDFFDYFIEISDLTVKTRLANEISDLIWLTSAGKKNYRTAIEFILDNDIEYEVVKSLVENSIIDPDYKYFMEKTALMFAAQRNTDVEVINCLLTHAKQPNAINENNWTAVMYAARYNPNPEILEQFIAQDVKIEPNEFGITLTMLASCNPNPGVLLKVPNVKTEMNLQTTAGKTALMYACENGQDISLINMLIEYFGAYVNIADNDGKTALMYAASSYNNLDVIKYLIDVGASVKMVDKMGNDINYYIESNGELKDFDLTFILSSENEIDASLNN